MKFKKMNRSSLKSEALCSQGGSNRRYIILLMKDVNKWLSFYIDILLFKEIKRKSLPDIYLHNNITR